MNEVYAVGVLAKLEDQVSPGLTRIIDLMERASAKTLEFGGALRSLSLGGSALAKNLDKALIAAGKFGDSPGLAAASTRLDTMAAASADIARNLEAAKAAGAGVGGPAGRTPPTTGGGGSGKSKAGGQAVEATGLAILGGVYENARLDDLNVKIVSTLQLPFDQWDKTMAHLRSKELEYTHQYAYATGGRVEPFGEAMLNAARLLRTMPSDKRELMTDTAMPYAALEAKEKNIPLPEALEAFIGLAHQAGAYSKEAAEPLFGAMVQASLTTHSSLDQIARAASYALPALHAAGANSSDVMMMLAVMQQSGIMNSKSGTWINALAENALPNTLGSGLFSNKKQNQALHELGLYKGGQALFYRNGHLDLMREVAILAEAREKMGALKFNAATRLGFGVQGQRAAAIFSENTTLDNLHALQALKNQEQDPKLLAELMQKESTVAKADQTIANANMTLMNASQTFTGPVNWLLDKTSNMFDATADFTKEHPALGAAGIAGGGFLTYLTGKAAWKGISKGASGLVGAISSRLGSALGFSLEGVAGTVAAAGGGVIGTAIVGGAALVGGAVGAALGFAFNEIFEIAHKVVTGKDGSYGTYLYDITHRDDPGATEMTRRAVEKRKHDSLNALPPPPTHKPAAESPKSADSKRGDQASVIHNHFYVDGKEIAATLIPSKTMGTTDMNPSSGMLLPAGGAYGLG